MKIIYMIGISKDLRSFEGKTLRVCIVGARAEAEMGPRFWSELAYLFPLIRWSLLFVGPDTRRVIAQYGARKSYLPNLEIAMDRRLYHEIHDDLVLHGEIPDLYVAFNPGVGHPSHSVTWTPTLSFASLLSFGPRWLVSFSSSGQLISQKRYLLETKRPIILTSLNEHDMNQDINALNEQAAGKFLWLASGANEFPALRHDIDQEHPRHMNFANWGVTAIKGK